jgi:S-adenosylmethionine:tRNA ribosyltransferase-isomerase
VKAAAAPRDRPRDARLLAVTGATGAFTDAHLADLPQLLDPGDLLVVNDAATLPASLSGTVRGKLIEVRLAAWRPGGAFEAVVFGAGDWHTRTENRPSAPVLAVGDLLQFSGLSARVERVDGPRLIGLRFDRADDLLVQALFRSGKPIQYAHLKAPLEPWDVQTPWAGRPWSMELPSASFPFSFELLAALRRKGIEVVPLTHGCGLSSTGDADLDARLPAPERYEIPEATAEAINACREAGRRIVAVGTSVTRALESAWDGRLRASDGIATLRISPAHRLRAVDALISGLHDPSESHFDLLGAFIRTEFLAKAWAHADESGYLSHEYGDLCLLDRA